MKLVRSLALITLVLLALAPVATAAQFGVRGGRYNDTDENFVGAEVAFPIGPVEIIPNVEYLLYNGDDNITAGTANLDVTYDFLRGGSVRPYVGGGVGLFYVDTDFGNDNTTVVNGIAGVKFNTSLMIKPYVQAKYIRDIENDGGGHDWAFTVGLRF